MDSQTDGWMDSLLQLDTVEAFRRMDSLLQLDTVEAFRWMDG